MTIRAGSGHAAALLFALLPAGCLQTVVLEHLGTGGGNGGVASGSQGGAGPGQGGTPGGDGGMVTDGSVDSVDKVRCPNGTSVTSFRAAREIPSIMIALDRSSVMGLRFGNSNNGTRFSVTHSAIEDVLMTYGSVGAVAQFGYVEFPGIPPDMSCSSSSGCCASGPIPLVKAGGDLRFISQKMDACSGPSSQVGCITTDSIPTGQALNRIESVYSIPDSSTHYALYAVLITGGQPTCSNGSSSDPPCMQVATQLNRLWIWNQPSVTTFVVGIGDIQGQQDGDGGNACLNNMAQAGGAPRTDNNAPAYYPAKSDDQVLPFLTSIVRSTACHLFISGDPNFDRNHVEIDFTDNSNNSSVIHHDISGQDGWDFDPNQNQSSDGTRIRFFGSACDRFIASANTSHQTVVKSCK